MSKRPICRLGWCGLPGGGSRLDLVIPGLDCCPGCQVEAVIRDSRRSEDWAGMIPVAIPQSAKCDHCWQYGTAKNQCAGCFRKVCVQCEEVLRCMRLGTRTDMALCGWCTKDPLKEPAIGSWWDEPAPMQLRKAGEPIPPPVMARAFLVAANQGVNKLLLFMKSENGTGFDTVTGFQSRADRGDPFKVMASAFLRETDMRIEEFMVSHVGEHEAVDGQCRGIMHDFLVVAPFGFIFYDKNEVKDGVRILEQKFVGKTWVDRSELAFMKESMLPPGVKQRALHALAMAVGTTLGHSPRPGRELGRVPFWAKQQVVFAFDPTVGTRAASEGIMQERKLHTHLVHLQGTAEAGSLPRSGQHTAEKDEEQQRNQQAAVDTKQDGKNEEDQQEEAEPLVVPANRRSVMSWYIRGSPKRPEEQRQGARLRLSVGSTVFSKEMTAFWGDPMIQELDQVQEEMKDEALPTGGLVDQRDVHFTVELAKRRMQKLFADTPSGVQGVNPKPFRKTFVINDRPGVDPFRVVAEEEEELVKQISKEQEAEMEAYMKKPDGIETEETSGAESANRKPAESAGSGDQVKK